jgi:Fe-Mn family superoxide dismutase
MARYRLPDLDYDFSALEPHISGHIMELHHQKHHKAYVDRANEVLSKLDDARGREDFASVSALERALAFSVSGHVLHSIFWKNLAPKAGDKPRGDLLRTIERDFGSFDAFRAQFQEVAAGLMGSGWAALVWEPLAKRLLISQVYDHQSNLSQSGVALMVLDAWEHAYYLQYENRKGEFFKACWNLWDWDDVEARLHAAQGLDLLVPEGAETTRGH